MCILDSCFNFTFARKPQSNGVNEENSHQVLVPLWLIDILQFLSNRVLYRLIPGLLMDSIQEPNRLNSTFSVIVITLPLTPLLKIFCRYQIPMRFQAKVYYMLDGHPMYAMQHLFLQKKIEPAYSTYKTKSPLPPFLYLLPPPPPLKYFYCYSYKSFFFYI